MRTFMRELGVEGGIGSKIAVSQTRVTLFETLLSNGGKITL